MTAIPSAIRPINIRTSGIPHSLHPLIKRVVGNVSTMNKARLIIVKDHNHNDPLLQLKIKLVVNTCIENGAVLLREGGQCLLPVPPQYSLLTAKRRQMAEEIGWDDMLFHAFCSKYYREKKALQKQLAKDALAWQMERVTASSDRRKEYFRNRLKLLVRLIRLVDERSETRQLVKKVVVDGRNLYMRKAICARPRKKKYVVGGTAHFTVKFLQKLSREPLIVISLN